MYKWEKELALKKIGITDDRIGVILRWIEDIGMTFEEFMECYDYYGGLKNAHLPSNRKDDWRAILWFDCFVRERYQ